MSKFRKIPSFFPFLETLSFPPYELTERLQPHRQCGAATACLSASSDSLPQFLLSPFASTILCLARSHPPTLQASVSCDTHINSLDQHCLLGLLASFLCFLNVLWSPFNIIQDHQVLHGIPMDGRVRAGTWEESVVKCPSDKRGC